MSNGKTDLKPYTHQRLGLSTQLRPCGRLIMNKNTDVNGVEIT